MACVLGGCPAAAPELIVHLKTNFLPGIELGRVEVLVLRRGPSEDAPVDLFETTELGGAPIDGAIPLGASTLAAPGTYLVRATLFTPTGAPLAGSATVVEVTQSRAVVLLASRECGGVACPGGGDPPSAIACVASRCVDPRCAPGAARGDAACPEPACAAASECPGSSAACATTECLEGVCYISVDHGACRRDELCSPLDGCVAADTGARDAGALDAGAADGGPIDAGPDDGGPPGDACDPLVESCDGTDEDCDGRVDEGFDLGTVERCGACDRRCPAVASATATCVAGTCSFECVTGFDDCNGVASDGCEARLDDPETCGSCRTSCVAPRPLCDGTGGAPVCTDACAASETLCGETCVDPMTDEAHCGACDRACDTGETCVGGSCRCGGTGPDCAGTPASTCCGTSCVDTTSDDEACGSCTIACDPGEECVSSACRCGRTGPDCTGSTPDCCGTTCVNLEQNETHCGTCGSPCPGLERCRSGACECDGMANGRGCGGINGGICCSEDCVSSWHDSNHCNGCGIRCLAGTACDTGYSALLGHSFGTCQGCAVDADCPRNFVCGFATFGGHCECAMDSACSAGQNCDGDGVGGSLDACRY